MTQSESLNDAQFAEIATGVQAILEEALKQNDSDGLSSCVQSIEVSIDADTVPSSESRAQGLPVLPQELASALQLEEYYQERTRQLKERKETQEKIRTAYRYFHLPRLPTEIVIRILSYLPRNRAVWIRTSTCGLSIAAYGLLPHFILQPSLLLPPYCSSFGEERTPEEVISLFKSVEDIKEMEMRAEILTVLGGLEFVGLYVKVYNWRNVLNGDDRGDEFQKLLQIPHRWEELVLCFANLEEIPQMLDNVAPCLPYLKKVTFQDEDRDSDEHFIYPGGPEPSIAVDSSKRITFPLHILLTLFNTGILDSVSMLKLDCSFFAQAEENTDTQKSSMRNLPHILSSMSCLESLILYIPDYSSTYYEEYKSLKVQSASLRTLALDNIGKNQEPFLTLFSDCQIETIYTHGWGRRLSNLAGLFPSIKKLFIVSTPSNRIYIYFNEISMKSQEEDLSELSSQSDGRFAFPRLEMLYINGLQDTNGQSPPLDMSKEDVDRIFGLVYDVVRNRSNTSGVASIKRVVIQELVADEQDLGEWEERIEQYVDALEFE